MYLLDCENPFPFSLWTGRTPSYLSRGLGEPHPIYLLDGRTLSYLSFGLGEPHHIYLLDWETVTMLTLPVKRRDTFRTADLFTLSAELVSQLLRVVGAWEHGGWLQSCRRQSWRTSAFAPAIIIAIISAIIVIIVVVIFVLSACALRRRKFR